MKASKKCPKCGGSEILTNEKGMKQGDRASFQVSSFTTFLIATYICSSCGFIEDYIEEDDLTNPKKMDKLREKWKKHS